MAKRDMLKTSDSVRGLIPAVYDMTAEDMNNLRAMGRADLFNAFTVAFRFGYCMGGRAALRGKFEERKKATAHREE